MTYFFPLLQIVMAVLGIAMNLTPHLVPTAIFTEWCSSDILCAVHSAIFTEG